jgi:hypothetical protein
MIFSIGGRAMQVVRGKRQLYRYMRTLVATRRNPVLRAFYLRLRAAGKKPKVALILTSETVAARLAQNDNIASSAAISPGSRADTQGG